MIDLVWTTESVVFNKLRSASHPEGPIHVAADRNIGHFGVAVRYAFAVGRKILKRDPRDAEGAALAVEVALLDVLPGALLRAVGAGGQAAAVPEIRSAWDPDQPRDDEGKWTDGDVSAAASKQIAQAARDFEQPEWYSPGDTQQRVVYGVKAGDTIPLSKPSVRGVDGNYDQLGAIHTGDTDYWKHRLEEDYDRDSSEARVIDIRTEETDVLIDDPQYAMDPSGGDKAQSSVLLTNRKELKYGRDWVFEGEDFRGLRSAARPLKFTFNAASPQAVAWAKTHAAELAKGISETTRKAIADAIASALELVGDLREGRDAILAAVGDEARATLIARHETMLAASEGQRQAWGQAVDKGLLTGEEKRTWIVTDDERLCPVCSELDGETADLDGEYPGGYDGPPAHVQCRCSEGLT